LLIAWGISSLAWLGVAFYRIAVFDRVQRRSSRESADLTQRVASLGAQLRLPRLPAVRVVSAEIAPMLWCAWTPATILVPQRLAIQLSPAQLDAVLAHELIHFDRRDHWSRSLSLVVLAVFWWNPVVWFVCRQLRQCEESCCDASLLDRLAIEQQTYAETLFRTVCFARGSRGPLPAIGFARENHLKQRIEAILDRPLCLTPSRAMWITLFAWTAFLPFSVQLVASQEPAKLTAEAVAAESTTVDVSGAAQLPAALSAAPGLPSWRIQRPYGELGFPGKQFGPQWEFVRLATHPPVLKELDANDDQRIQLKGVWNSLLAKDGQWHQIEKSQPDLIQNEFDQVTSILSSEQQQRVRELIVQRKGLSAFLDEQLGREIAIRQEQAEAIRREIQAHSRRVATRNKARDDQLKTIAVSDEKTDVIAERLRLTRLEANQTNRQSLAQAWHAAWEVLSSEQRRAYEKFAGGPSP
jgi:hypothetical protein